MWEPRGGQFLADPRTVAEFSSLQGVGRRATMSDDRAGPLFGSIGWQPTASCRAGKLTLGRNPTRTNRQPGCDAFSAGSDG